MNVYTLDIDSSERDPTIYPNPNDYIVELKNPIYNITKISLISARIHASQLLINDNNNTFTIGNEIVTLDNNNYDGKGLANEVSSKYSNISSAVYNSNNNTITFTGNNPFSFKFYTGENGFNSNVDKTTPHDILGLTANDIESTNNTIITGSLNLQGPDALIVKLSSGSDEFNKTVFSDTPFYTGRILMCGDVINYSGADDAVDHYFHSGPQKSINRLKIQFYYSSNNRLIPYDFRNANHVLKLSIFCSTDKAESATRIKPIEKIKETNEDIETENKVENYPDLGYSSKETTQNWDGFIMIVFIVFIGTMLLVFTKRKIRQ